MCERWTDATRLYAASNPVFTGHASIQQWEGEKRLAEAACRENLQPWTDVVRKLCSHASLLKHSTLERDAFQSVPCVDGSRGLESLRVPGFAEV